MRIVPCCMIANPDIYELGNANDLSKLWNGKSFHNFRKDHITGNIPKVCENCYANN